MKLREYLVSVTLPGAPPSVGPIVSVVGRAVDEAGVANLSLMEGMAGE
ncbi:MAG: hypothetical protein H0V86_14450 [Chloroflexia bacterium]|nr:hypothetical protein [Chloroflexia bacterium]